MKKYLLTASIMLATAMVYAGPLRDTPVGPAGALATADYGGVLYSTNAFGPVVVNTGVNSTTACITAANFACHGVFYGVIFSTGDTSNFVDVFDSTSTDAGVRQGAIVRLFNVNASTGGVGAFAAGFSGVPKPIRFSEGLIVRPNVATLNSVTTLYSQER